MGRKLMTDQRMFSWREHVQSARLPSTTKLVLLTLSTHMTRMGESCFPTTRQIAWECSLSRVSVMKHLADAEDLGWITRSAHGFAGQRWKNHEYRPAIPDGAKIVLWHESEDGIDAIDAQNNALKAGQPPLPRSEKAGKGALPPLSEAGQPHDESWSTSREKVVKEVDLSSSIALQVGVHSNNISEDETVFQSVKPLATSADWMDWLVERFGYIKHRMHNANNVVLLSTWVKNDYSVGEVESAVMLSQDRTGQDQPPIAYITPVLESNRKVSTPRCTKPESQPGYEAPADRAERMAREFQAEQRQLGERP